MSRVYICGVGAVSPAGWGLEAMRAALRAGKPLPTQNLARPGWEQPLRARLVPAPATRQEFLAHPRLRRASPLTHYCAAAAIEALSGLRTKAALDMQLGLIVCLDVGCVQYSSRFFQEVLAGPATASPLIFPETVFSAPVSHVAALLSNTPRVCTLVGDGGCFLQGMALASDWLEEKTVESCLVIGAEEINWLVADAEWHLERSAVVSAGSGAVCMSLEPNPGLGIELTSITHPHTFTSAGRKLAAVKAMRKELPLCSPGSLLCDGLQGSPRSDAPELTAWSDWTEARLSPKSILGEGLMAAAAWQCIAACDAVATGGFAAATVSVVGSNQQAIGACFAALP